MFESEAIGETVAYNVLVPPSYEDGADRYPVRYWLHGRGGGEARDPRLAPGAVTVTELQMLTWGGFSSEAILTEATSEAAKALGLSDLGTLDPGKLADLIVVDGNPLGDLSALRNVDVVVKGGKVVVSN